MVKRGLLAGLLLLVLGVIQQAPQSPAVAVASVQGDVNCGGTVTAVDALQALRSVAGLSTTAGCLAEAGDTNCSGKIDAVDALRILRYVAGLTNTVPAGCAPIGESLLPPPTSEELIAAALVGGTITYEQSLLYRALALYDLPGLPEEFRSRITDLDVGRRLFAEIESNRATLSQSLLDALAPIMARPNDPTSIFNNPPVRTAIAAPAVAATWRSSAVPSTNVRVWIKDTSDAPLTGYATAVGSIWPKLQQVFGLPTPDTITNPPADANPDTMIDIYFTNVAEVDPRNPGCASCTLEGSNGLTTPTATSGNTSSAYIQIRNSLSGDYLLKVIAHELAHAVQNTYDYNDSAWISDATADWVAFRVLQELATTTRANLYPRAQIILDNPDKPLSRDEGESRYAAWLYFLFASMNSGDAIVKSVWQKAAAPGEQGVNAADQAFPFASNFDDFTVRNWNEKPPLVTAYKDADSTFPGIKPKTQPWFFASDEERKESDAINPLAARYYRYAFSNVVRKVTINKLITGNPDAHVWALVKIGADWKPPEDWSSKVVKTFCRELPDQNVTDLVLIVSNSSLTNPIPAFDKLKTKAETKGCNGWLGTSSGFSHYQCCSGALGNLAASVQTLDAVTTADVLWEEDPNFLYGCSCVALFPTGSIDWTVDYQVVAPDPAVTCSDTASGHVAAGTGLQSVTQQMMIRWDDPDNPNQYVFSRGGTYRWMRTSIATVASPIRWQTFWAFQPPPFRSPLRRRHQHRVRRQPHAHADPNAGADRFGSQRNGGGRDVRSDGSRVAPGRNHILRQLLPDFRQR